jgi:hypothetical protein
MTTGVAASTSEWKTSPHSVTCARVEWDKCCRPSSLWAATTTGQYTHYTTLHYYTILHYTHYTTLHYYTILHYTILHYTVLHYTVLYYTTLYYTLIFYTILHYTILTVWYTYTHISTNILELIPHMYVCMCVRVYGCRTAEVYPRGLSEHHPTGDYLSFVVRNVTDKTQRATCHVYVRHQCDTTVSLHSLAHSYTAHLFYPSGSSSGTDEWTCTTPLSYSDITTPHSGYLCNGTLHVTLQLTLCSAPVASLHTHSVTELRTRTILNIIDSLHEDTTLYSLTRDLLQHLHTTSDGHEAECSSVVVAEASCADSVDTDLTVVLPPPTHSTTSLPLLSQSQCSFTSTASMMSSGVVSDCTSEGEVIDYTHKQSRTHWPCDVRLVSHGYTTTSSGSSGGYAVVSAHTCVLAARSPVLRTLLLRALRVRKRHRTTRLLAAALCCGVSDGVRDLGEGTTGVVEIDVSDVVSPDALSSLVFFLYTDKWLDTTTMSTVSVRVLDLPCALLWSSSELRIPGLMELCAHILLTHLRTASHLTLPQSTTCSDTTRKRVSTSVIHRGTPHDCTHHSHCIHGVSDVVALVRHCSGDGARRLENTLLREFAPAVVSDGGMGHSTSLCHSSSQSLNTSLHLTPSRMYMLL